MIVMDLRDALQAQMNSTIMLMRASGYSEQDILDCTSQARAALADDLRAPSPSASANTIPTCCITGAIPGDGGACGDCDPCIFGEALVPKAVKRLIAEKNSLLQRVGELEDAASIAAEESDTPSVAGTEREAIARTILVEVLGFKKPERAGQYNRDLASKAADIIAAMYEPKAECEPFIRVLASLAAAVSLLERAGKAAKKAAASDKMFDQMLADYRGALEAGRAALRRTVAETGGPVAWRRRVVSNARLRGVRVWDYFTNEPADDPLFEKEALFSPAAPSPAVLAECLGAIDQLERAKYPQRFEEARATIRAALAQPATAGEP